MAKPTPNSKRHHHGIIRSSSRQLAALPNLQLSNADVQTLTEYYNKRIERSQAVLDTYKSLMITVHSPIHL